MKLIGQVVKGHQIASGNASSLPFSAGTIALQKPFFKQLGLDLSAMFDGTINVAVKSLSNLDELSLRKPDYRFEHVKWTNSWPAEHFDFYACQFTYQNKCYPAFIYQPKTETKVGHFQPSNVVEVIAPFIDGLSYGDELELWVSK